MKMSKVLENFIPNSSQLLQKSWSHTPAYLQKDYTIPSSVEDFYSEHNPLYSAATDKDVMRALSRYTKHFSGMKPEVRSAVIEEMANWRASEASVSSISSDLWQCRWSTSRQAIAKLLPMS